MKKICVITGGSSGIGKSAALFMLKNGYSVYEFSRRESNTPDICHISVDVSDSSAVKNAVSEVFSKEGRIDVLINCAGFGISGAAEFTDIESAQKQFDVNFFGAVRVCNEVIPIMREQGFGKIVNVGSVAGVISIPFQSFYSASKAALLSYTEALANELRPFEISAVCILPGDIKTGFTSARKKENAGDDIYSGRISRSVSVMEKDEENGMNADSAGRYIAKIASSKSRKPVKTIGVKYKLFIFLTKILPTAAVNKIVGKIYAK